MEMLTLLAHCSLIQQIYSRQDKGGRFNQLSWPPSHMLSFQPGNGKVFGTHSGFTKNFQRILITIRVLPFAFM